MTAGKLPNLGFLPRPKPKGRPGANTKAENAGPPVQFKFLNINKINFIIRLSKTSYKEDISAGGKAYSALIKRALRGRTVGRWFELEGYRYQFIGLCHQDGPQSSDPLVLLVSTLNWSKTIIAQRYRIRWTTECFFKHLKSNGFDREERGFQSPKKIRLLVAIVVVLYVICGAEGLRQFNRIRAKKKNYDEPLSLREAVFRKGYSVVVNELVSGAHFVDWLLIQLTKPLKVPIRLFFFQCPALRHKRPAGRDRA